ncbi:MAG: type I restriction endonuclease subunit R, partial [Nitrospirae bacterium]
PYENEALEMVKPHGFVMDFVGIFDKLERALAFDSDEVNAIVKDIGLLKALFKEMMEEKAPEYLRLIKHNFDDRDVDGLIEHFRDKDRRKTFFKEYKEIEMLYEIISPDAFLRPYLDDYTTLSAIYDVVRKAYTRTVYVDRAFLRKTNELVQRHIGARYVQPVQEFFEIKEETAEYISKTRGGESTRVINLIKSIEKTAEEQSTDPFLIALSERAQAVKEQFENRQISTQKALKTLLEAIEGDEKRKKEQEEKGLNAIEFFVLKTLEDEGVQSPEEILNDIRTAFKTYENWRNSEADLRELRKEVTFAILKVVDDIDRVTATVNRLFSLLQRGGKE